MAKKRGPDTFLSRLFTRHNDLRKIENARAREMRKTMLGIKDRSLAIIERNMTTFREAGEYIDSAAALGRAQQTVADIDALVAQQADWATGNVLSMRKEAWTQGVSDIEFATGKLPLDIQSKMAGSFGQVFPEAAFSAIEHPVLGVSPKNMFNGVRAGTTQNMRNLLTGAVISGESVQETGRKISQALDLSVAAGERIARTNVNAAYNEAQKAVYDANSDIIIGYQWEATFDDRTTLICFDLHGNFWPLGSKTPGPPAHWNCRSILLPVFKDPAVQDLITQTPRRARFYDKAGKPTTRLVAGDTTPTTWLRSQPKDIQRNVLGTKLKTDLFRRKMISIDDIVDPSLRVLSDNEVLRRAAAKHPGNDYIGGLLKKRAIGKVPSQASVLKSDAALARKQPWRAPEISPSIEDAVPKIALDPLMEASHALGNVPVTSIDTSPHTLAAVKMRAEVVTSEIQRMRKEFAGFDEWIAKKNKAIKGVKLSGDKMVTMPSGQKVFGFYDPQPRTLTLGLIKKLRTGKLTLGRRTWGVSKDAFDGILRHEVGHAFFRDMANRSAQNRWFDIYEKHWAFAKWQDEVSPFAQTNPMEAFAEAFTAFTHIGYKQGMLPVDIESFLKKLVGVR